MDAALSISAPMGGRNANPFELHLIFAMLTEIARAQACNQHWQDVAAAGAVLEPLPTGIARIRTFTPEVTRLQ